MRSKQIIRILTEIKDGIQNLSKITVIKPGDSVLFAVSGIRNQEDIMRIRRMIETHPPNFQYYVIPIEWKVDVVRKEV